MCGAEIGDIAGMRDEVIEVRSSPSGSPDTWHVSSPSSAGTFNFNRSNVITVYGLMEEFLKYIPFYLRPL
jgi:hypothetical protein